MNIVLILFRDCGVQRCKSPELRNLWAKRGPLTHTFRAKHHNRDGLTVAVEVERVESNLNIFGRAELQCKIIGCLSRPVLPRMG